MSSALIRVGGATPTIKSIATPLSRAQPIAGLAQPSTAQLSAAQLSAAELSSGQLSSAQLRSAQLS